MKKMFAGTLFLLLGLIAYFNSKDMLDFSRFDVVAALTICISAPVVLSAIVYYRESELSKSTWISQCMLALHLMGWSMLILALVLVSNNDIQEQLVRQGFLLYMAFSGASFIFYGLYQQLYSSFFEENNYYALQKADWQH